MNGEKLLRAMSYVDEDLVARAEKATRRKNAWVRWAALAACLCLALGGWMALGRMSYGAKSADTTSLSRNGEAGAMTAEAAPQEAADEEPPQARESGRKADTGGGGNGDWFLRMEPDSAINASADLSVPIMIRSRQELEGYSIPPEVLERYPEDFFETQDLLLVSVGGGPEHPQVIRLVDAGYGWTLTLSGTADGEDAVQWRLLLPVEKNQIPENADIMIKEEETK